METHERRVYLVLKRLLSQSSKNQRQVVLKFMESYAKNSLSPHYVVSFLRTYYTSQVYDCAVNGALKEEYEDKMFKARKMFDPLASTMSVCTECLTYEATHVLPSCCEKHKSVCFGCLDEDDRTQKCLHCHES